MARVRGEVELLPLDLDLHVDPVEVDVPRVHELPSVGPLDLVAREQDRALGVLADQVQVVEDGAPVQHAAGAHDDFAPGRELPCPGAVHNLHAVHGLPERLRGPDVLGMLHVDRVHLLPHAVEPDLVAGLGQGQEDVLGPGPREGGPEGDPAAGHDLLHLLQEGALGLEPLRVLAARVGRLDEQGVALDRLRAPDEVRAQGMQVAREQHGLVAVDLVHRRAGDIEHAADDDAAWFAAGVSVDGLHHVGYSHRSFLTAVARRTR